jgi:hypothetical protein
MAPYQQMSLLFACCIFDFQDAQSFPFYGSEGGCGKLPPFSNLATGWSAMHRFHNGRAKGALLGIMDEAVRVQQGLLKPSETFFIRASHIAQLGDKRWAKYTDAFRALHEGKSRTETTELISALAEKPILPQEYDFPNIERSLEPGTYNRRFNSVSFHTGGFLRRATVSNVAAGTNWSAVPLSEIRK